MGRPFAASSLPNASGARSFILRKAARRDCACSAILSGGCRRARGEGMKILPAIDIKDGRCVRLYQGDFERLTTYDADPAQVAQRWQEAGASWLHVVDLDGALTGQPANSAVIQRIR